MMPRDPFHRLRLGAVLFGASLLFSGAAAAGPAAGPGAAPPAAAPPGAAAPAAASPAALAGGGGAGTLLPPGSGVEDIPHFARRYGLECRHCHVSPPKLNEFGEAFVRNNYRLAELEGRDRRTLPLAVWLSSRADLVPGNEGAAREVRAYVNRLEIISGGQVVAPWLSYFVEWRPVSFELRGDGTLRDRSGRFEDLFLTVQRDRLEVSVGQFRQIEQIDISRRLGVNEPAFFSRSLPGAGPGTPREVALRAFSLSGRAPGVRAGWIQDRPGGWEWSTFVTVPVPGELSLPLTSEARREASNELDLNAKGIFLESFVRRGLVSYGMHAFLDSRERYQTGAVATGRAGPWMWTGALGAARTGGSLLGRWSAEGEYVLNYHATFGARAEGQAGTDPGFIAYGNLHFPGTKHTFRLTVEQRLVSGRGATLVELGAVF